jgi:uncharacterized membrane protein YccC
MGSRLRTVLALTAALLLGVLAPANAYIDAGSTSVIFSALVAFFASAGMILKMSWRRITGVFRRGDAATEGPDEA